MCLVRSITKEHGNDRNLCMRELAARPDGVWASVPSFYH